MSNSGDNLAQQSSLTAQVPVGHVPGAKVAPPYLPRIYKPGLERTLPVEQRPPRLYASLLAIAVITGIACNLLFSEARGVGFNLLLQMLVFFAGWYVIAIRRQLPRWRFAAAVAALAYCVALAGRASEILTTVNALLVIGFTALACTPAYAPRLKNIGATLVDLTQVLFNVFLGWILFFAEVPWRRFRPEKHNLGAASGVLTGILISLPFLVVFGFLFSRAEVRFQEFFGSILPTLATFIFENFWITVGAMLLAAGLLRSSFISAPLSEDKAESTKAGLTIGPVESATVLSLLNALFLVFVITQLPYLFGGQDRITRTPDLAWSEYARRGFFELAWVAALLIPTLLFFLNCTRSSNVRQSRVILILGAILSGFTGIVIASALQRMLLYTHTFGLTELRIYVSAFIILLALVIFLLNVFSFTGRQQLFVPSALVLGVLFSFGIQVINVQGTIARDIIERQQTGRGGDMEYLRRLSTDAVPAILSSRLSASEKHEAVQAITVRCVSGQGAPGILDHPISVVRGYASARAASIISDK